jgi:hypothetical protein
MDEEERQLPDDPCDHITDIIGWTKLHDKTRRSGATQNGPERSRTGEILRVDAMENASRRSKRKKFLGFGLSD